MLIQVFKNKAYLYINLYNVKLLYFLGHTQIQK